MQEDDNNYLPDPEGKGKFRDASGNIIPASLFDNKPSDLSFENYQVDDPLTDKRVEAIFSICLDW